MTNYTKITRPENNPIMGLDMDAFGNYVDKTPVDDNIIKAFHVRLIDDKNYVLISTFIKNYGNRNSTGELQKNNGLYEILPVATITTQINEFGININNIKSENIKAVNVTSSTGKFLDHLQKIKVALPKLESDFKKYKEIYKNFIETNNNNTTYITQDFKNSIMVNIILCEKYIKSIKAYLFLEIACNCKKGQKECKCIYPIDPTNIEPTYEGGKKSRRKTRRKSRRKTRRKSRRKTRRK